MEGFGCGFVRLSRPEMLQASIAAGIAWDQNIICFTIPDNSTPLPTNCCVASGLGVHARSAVRRHPAGAPSPPSPPCIAERQLPWARQYGGLAAGRMRSRLHAGTQPQPPPTTQITHCACHPQVGFALAVSQTGTETKALLTGSFTGALWIDIFETSTVNVGVTVRDATLGCFLQAVKPGRCSLLLATAAFP